MPLLRLSSAALVFACVFGIAATAAGQCTKKIAELPAAPELLGFRLGMTKDEIKAHVPQTDFGKTDHFGVSKTTINPYFDPKIDKTKFEGVRSISLDLLDQKLTSLWIGYDENFKAKNVDEFVKLITPALQLPAGWRSWKYRGQQMRCADFQLIVTMVAGGPSLRVLDVAAEETVAVRRQQKEEQDSAADAGQTAEAAQSPEAARATEAGGAATPETTAAPEIIADKKSKTYYLGTCRPEKAIAEPDRIVFKTTDEAEKAGFKLAKNCH